MAFLFFNNTVFQGTRQGPISTLILLLFKISILKKQHLIKRYTLLYTLALRKVKSLVSRRLLGIFLKKILIYSLSFSLTYLDNQFSRGCISKTRKLCLYSCSRGTAFPRCREKWTFVIPLSRKANVHHYFLVDLLMSTSTSSTSTSSQPVADLEIIERALLSVSDMLERVLTYVRAVLSGEKKGDPAIGRYLMNTLGASTGDLEKGGFNSSLQVCVLILTLNYPHHCAILHTGYINDFLSCKPCAVASRSIVSFSSYSYIIVGVGFLRLQVVSLHVTHLELISKSNC